MAFARLGTRRSKPARGSVPGAQPHAPRHAAPRHAGFDFARLAIASPRAAASDGRGVAGGGAGDALTTVDSRPGESQDRVHQSMLDQFRRQQGLPQGGVDNTGTQVGPSDGQIKYRPQPIGLLNGPFHAPIDDPDEVGMEIAITVQSSGVPADMASVLDTEQVSLSFDHTGSFVGTPPIASRQSDFMPGVNIPNDRHGASRAGMIAQADNHGGAGSFSKYQLDIYKHPHYAIINPLVIPNSGYRITRSIIADTGTKLRFRVEKRPEACTVNGFTTEAGPSTMQTNEVVLRA